MLRIAQVGGDDLVGRESELAAAEAFLDRVASGAAPLLVEGEAGIGKTALWRAIATRATERGYRVLACQCEQAEARLSFVGLGDLLGGQTVELPPALPELQRHALAVALLREAPRGDRAPDPRTLAVAFSSLLAELARERPVVVAADDLQWLDAPTARLLAFAARRLGGHRVGLLGTSRTPASAAGRRASRCRIATTATACSARSCGGSRDGRRRTSSRTASSVPCG